VKLETGNLKLDKHGNPYHKTSIKYPVSSFDNLDLFIRTAGAR